MREFKVGDRVKVNITDENRYMYNGFGSTGTQGKIYIIEDVDSKGEVNVSYRLNRSNWHRPHYLVPHINKNIVKGEL